MIVESNVINVLNNIKNTQGKKDGRILEKNKTRLDLCVSVTTYRSKAQNPVVSVTGRGIRNVWWKGALVPRGKTDKAHTDH